MSSLAGKLGSIEEEHSVTQQKCPVARIIFELDEEDGQALKSVIKSGASIRAIHRTLREAGFAIERQSISLHREGRCRCENEQEGSK